MALQLATAAGGGDVTLVSMAPNGETSGLRTALAMGAASAILVSDDALKGSDALSTAKVLAAAIKRVEGADLIIIIFAVVVIGGMGSIMGSIVTGFALGVVEGLTKFFYPEASNTVIFVIMAIVLLIKPAGLFGRASA